MTQQAHVRKTHFLGTKLRALRKRNGLTLEELSARCVQLDPRGAPSIMLRYEIDGAPRGSSWMQRADNSSSVRPFLFLSARSLVPRKCVLRTWACCVMRRPNYVRVKLTL